MTHPGELITIDGRPALRFERTLQSSRERVWRAVTEPAELAQWFLAPISWTPTPGEAFEAFGQSGTVTTLIPPRELAWEWNGQTFTIELAESGESCVLVFTHVFAERADGAQQAAGWDGYLDRLEALVGGGFLAEEDAHASIWQRHEEYAERFGLDPGPGRQMLADYRTA